MTTVPEQTGRISFLERELREDQQILMGAFQRLADQNPVPWCRRMANLQDCQKPWDANGDAHPILRTCPHGHVTLGPAPRCGVRWCPKCNGDERLRKLQAILTALQFLDPANLRNVTLSTSSNHNLAEASAALETTWHRFRTSPEFRAHVTGCIAIWETTLSEEQGWHPHLHLIAEGSYWDQDKLAALWVRCSGGVANPAAQWIQKLETPKKWANYVAAKYLSKGLMAMARTIPTVRLAELIEHTYGKRTLRTYGSCYNATEPEQLVRGKCGRDGCEERVNRVDVGGIGWTLAWASYCNQERAAEQAKQQGRDPP